VRQAEPDVAQAVGGGQFRSSYPVFVPATIGRAMRRREDPHLITGHGRYAGDIHLPEQLQLVFVRSPQPHARIRSIDTEAASAMPGVLAVWTAADLPATARALPDWLPRGVTPRPRTVLADGEVNYVGEAIAAVAAETAYQAADAAEAVFADLEPLPAVGNLDAALADGAPVVHAGASDNLAGGYERAYGDIEAAFGEGAVIVSEKLRVPRIAGAAMEPRAATAESDGARLKVWTSTQHTYGVRARLAELLELDNEAIEVLAEDVGGGFGPKAQVYPEEIVCAFAALRLKRPVRWVATRSEDTATTVHAHGSIFEIDLAADPDGRLRGLRGRMWHDIGAFPASGPAQPGLMIAHMVSAYRLPALRVEATLVHTNAASTGFVRGGGRPAGNFVIERMIDRMALRLDLDPAEMRRRNLVQPAEMPFDTGYPAGRQTVIYDSGDYPALLAAALEAVGYDGVRREQAAAGSGSDRLRGVGIACCVESSGFGSEQARVHLGRDGIATAFVGSTPQGQGHLTAAAQVVAERLDWPLERVQVVAGDTRAVEFGEMTAGSRTAVQVGNAASLAAQTARRWLLEHAAEKLEADPVDLLLEEGVISVKGAPASSVPAADLVPEAGLDFVETFQPPLPNAYSSGCHAAVVEVDPETGSVDVVRYVVAHDTGRAINPMIVEGQIQGGYAHGLGYALFEELIYQSDGGFQSASFLDYTIASAPELAAEPIVLPMGTATPANAEGFKGAGESGTVPVPAAIANAVEDAVRRLRPDAAITELPISPLRLLEALA
jgi:carbon-monoxide dehydrogenase large subunit